MNTTLEPDFYRLLPPDVTVHSQRLWSPPRPTQEDVDGPTRLRRMNRGIPRAVQHLMTAQVDLIVYGCTSGSFSWGPGGETEIGERISRQSGKPVVVTSDALIEAIRSLGATRISVATPYPRATNERLARFLQANGFDVVSIVSDPIGSAGSFEMTNEDPADIRQFVVGAVDRHSDLVVCPCTAWRALEVVSSLEAELGLPVVTSNQAVIWSSLRLLGVTAPGPGALFLQ